MDVFTHFRRRTAALLRRMASEGALPPRLDLERFAVEPPPPGVDCDLVVDAALVYAGQAAAVNAAPGALARALAEDLSADPAAAAADVAGPGFVNVRLRPDVARAAVASVLRGGSRRARVASETAVTVIAEIRDGASTAALSLDEARAAVVADLLAALSAAAGSAVAREWHIGGLGAEATRAALAPLRIRQAAPGAPGPRGEPTPVVVRPCAGPAGGGRSAAIVACRPVSLRLPDGAARTSAPGPARPGLDAVLRGIGVDAFRFAVAARRADLALDLWVAEAADRSRDAPSFWVPYAHARARGILRRAGAMMPHLDLSPAALARADLSRLEDPGEAALARCIMGFPHAVSAAAAARAPHRLASYMSALAEAVHARWNRSKDQPQLRFVREDERDLTEARLGLMTASAMVLRSGLGILGVEAPEEMC